MHGRGYPTFRPTNLSDGAEIYRLTSLFGRSCPSGSAPACPVADHTTLAQLLAPYCDLVRELGGVPEPLLEAAGIDLASLTDPVAKIPLRAIGQLLEDTAAALACPNLGLRLAERQSIEAVMNPLEGLLSNAPTIREVITCSINHIEAFNSGLLMGLESRVARPHYFVSFELMDGLLLFPQLLEQLVLLTHNSLAWLSAGFARSRTVWFSHRSLGTPASYARRFGTTVKFCQEYNGLILHDADMAAKVADCDAERYATESRVVAELYPARPASLNMEVRQIVHRILANSDDCSRQRVADILGLQERTLNRRLSKIGTSFEAIRDEVRRNLAFRYLAHADLPLTEIAGRLGYSELAVLSRSCRRWFGVPPGQLRQIVTPPARLAAVR